MDFRDSLSTDLPSPRDDEPANLRDDIVDELADHLACMYRRELLRGADAASAKARVVEGFGDPADVARRLWFDAMKGKIMSQRILVSCCTFLTLISLALAGVLWVEGRDSRRMAALMTARAEQQAHEAQEAQAQLLKQLAVLSKAVENPRSPDWIPVSFKLTQETLVGPPGVGFQAALGRGTGGSNKPEAIQRDSDANGMVDFGVVQPGDWEFRISRKLDDESSWHTLGKLNVGLGSKIEKSIICPRISTVQTELKVRIDWPADLAGKNLAAMAVFHHKGFAYQPPLRWTLSLSRFSAWWDNQAVFITATGKRSAGIKMQGFYFWQLASPSESPVGTEPSKSLAAGPYRPDQVYLDISGQDQARELKSIPWHEGEYQVMEIAVVKPAKNAASSFHGERCALLGLAGHRFQNQSAHLLPEPPTDMTNPWNGAGSYAQTPFDVLRIDDSYWTGLEPSLVVKRDQPNNWTLHLPDELTKAVREKLRNLSEK